MCLVIWNGERIIYYIHIKIKNIIFVICSFSVIFAYDLQMHVRTNTIFVLKIKKTYFCNS